MALLWMDSFDHYVTADLLDKYTDKQTSNVVITAATGRNSSAGLVCTNNVAFLAKGLSVGSTTIIVGFACKVTTFNCNICEIGESGAAHAQLYVNADGSLSIHRGNAAIWATGAGTVLSTSAPGLISLGSYNHIQFKVTVGDSPSGSAEVRLNGVTVTSVSSVDTRNGGTGSITLCDLGGQATFDDFWVCDSTGSAPWNDFLGDCRVDTRNPTAAGATTGFTPSTGSNWQNVDDTAPDDDTTYNSASGVATDTFVVQDAPVVGATIYGVQHNINMKKTDAGVCTVASVIRHSGTDNVGSNISPGTGYAYGTAINQTNPGTSAAWTEAGFNAAEFGYKRTT